MDEQKDITYKGLALEVYNYFKEKKYNLIEPPFDKITSKGSISITYICHCGHEKHSTYRDMLRRECRFCKNLLLSTFPEDFSAIDHLIKENTEDEWRIIKGGFISKLGKAANYFGKILTLDERGRYYFCGKLQYAHILIAEAFKIKDYEKLNGVKSDYVAKLTSDVISVDNIKVSSRTDIAVENGKNSKQSKNFQEKLEMDFDDHKNKFKFAKVHELDKHYIFEDGNIYNSNRFLTFSTSNSSQHKVYQTLCTKEKTYYVHKLVCMAFYPIKDKLKYDDYKDLQVNHKDGNTLNNHKDNLEWSTASQNMQHAYTTSLNKKVRGVIQYIKNKDNTKGEKLNEFISIAEASRKTKAPEHHIREFSYGRSKYGEFFWEFKEEKEEGWNEKFCSRPTVKQTLNKKKQEDKHNFINSNCSIKKYDTDSEDEE